MTGTHLLRISSCAGSLPLAWSNMLSLSHLDLSENVLTGEDKVQSMEAKVTHQIL